MTALRGKGWQRNQKDEVLGGGPQTKAAVTRGTGRKGDAKGEPAALVGISTKTEQRREGGERAVEKEKCEWKNSRWDKRESWPAR